MTLPPPIYVIIEIPQYDNTETTSSSTDDPSHPNQQGNETSNLLNNLSTQAATIIGIDSDKPILQINNMLFQGSYSNILGTDIILNENGSVECVTNKKLVMKQIFIQEKNENMENIEDELEWSEENS